MSKIAQVLSNTTMVNYTSVLTSVPNEIYIPKTESPESLASLMKDSITIEFFLNPAEDKEIKKVESETRTAFNF